MIIGKVTEHYEKVSSTNTVAAEKLSLGKATEGMVITASFQDSGRGQMSNKWESEPGKNLLMSIVLFPDFVAPEDQFHISRIISLAVCELVAGETPGARIKWPNDIYVNNDKIAGILIENNILGNRLISSIAGIGLNINQLHFRSDARNPVSLSQITGREYDIMQIRDTLAGIIDKRYKMLLRNETGIVVSDYINSLYRRGEWHKYTDKSGEFTGMIEDVTESGLLLVRKKNGSLNEYAFKEIDYSL